MDIELFKIELKINGTLKNKWFYESRKQFDLHWKKRSRWICRPGLSSYWLTGLEMVSVDNRIQWKPIQHAKGGIEEVKS